MVQMLSDEQLIEIAEVYGTPVYVYHAEKITEQYNKLTTAFTGNDVVFFYASKALTNLNILKHICSLGANIDCSSINEARFALMAGFKPEQVLYTSNGIDFGEITEAVNLGIHINIDSLSNLEKFGKKFGHTYPVGIRLRPNIMAGGNINISTGHNKSKFGIPVEQTAAIKIIAKKYDLLIKGLHIHTGSDIQDADTFVKGIDVLFDIIPQFSDLEFIDLGGGFKVSYKEGDIGTDMVMLAKKVQDAFEKHPQNKHLQIWFEPGKFLVSDCGYLVTKVNVVKESMDTTFVAVNSSFNHLIRPMFYNAYHTIKNISNPDGKENSYVVVGNICETDTFAWDRNIPEIREGDYLVFLNAGAYGFEMSSNFNSRLKPAEVMFQNGKARLIRRADVFEDLLKNQVI